LRRRAKQVTRQLVKQASGALKNEMSITRRYHRVDPLTLEEMDELEDEMEELDTVEADPEGVVVGVGEPAALPAPFGSRIEERISLSAFSLPARLRIIRP